MRNLAFVGGLIAICAMKAVWVLSIWLMVVGALALIGAMRAVWVWRNRPPRSR